MTFMKAVRVLLIGLAAAACSHPLEPTLDPQTGTYSAEFSGNGNLVQRIVLSTANPSKGSVLNVTSTIINHGVNREVSTRICGLDLSGVQMVNLDLNCQGYSMKTTLATNDSIVQTDRRTIQASPGDYTLRIRHLLDPERWVELKLHVK